MAVSKREVPGKESKEADKQQLKIARDQGDSFDKSVQAMRKETGRGKSIKVQDYLVTYTEENAEGLYEWEGKQLVWHNPERDNAHIEIVVEDAADGRFVPYLDVRATVFDSGKDKPLQELELPFMWHPWLYHYGTNLKIDSGTYDLLVFISELHTPRHDKQNGKRFTKPVEVRFDNVSVTTGQKMN